MANDDDILAAVQRGDDHAAFELVMELYENTMFDRALAVLRDQSLAQDAVQAAMIKVLRTRTRLEDVRNLRGWLLQVVTNTALDIWRLGKRQKERVERLRQEGGLDTQHGADPAELDGEREYAALNECLGELDPVTRAAFLRRHRDEASWEEIGSELGMEVDAARMRVKRALKGLRRCLQRQEVER